MAACYDAVSLLTFATPSSAPRASPGLAISLGDPAGIGPEIVARALAHRNERHVMVYGDAGVIARAAAAVGVPPPPPERIRSVTRLTAGDVTPGRPDARSGQAQVDYLRAATEAVLRGEHAGLVTAPISKDWAARAGFGFPGHTEFL